MTLMKFVNTRPYADPDAAARKLMEIANSVEPVQDGRIYIEKINWPLSFATLAVTTRRGHEMATQAIHSSMPSRIAIETSSATD